MVENRRSPRLSRSLHRKSLEKSRNSNGRKSQDLTRIDESVLHTILEEIIEVN